jgi:hypothetical protein
METNIKQRKPYKNESNTAIKKQKSFKILQWLNVEEFRVKK